MRPACCPDAALHSNHEWFLFFWFFLFCFPIGPCCPLPSLVSSKRKFSLGFTRFYWVLLGFTGFYWVLLSFIGFYWVLLDFTWFYWVSLDFTGFHLVLLGFTGS